MSWCDASAFIFPTPGDLPIPIGAQIRGRVKHIGLGHSVRLGAMHAKMVPHLRCGMSTPVVVGEPERG
jgi:hypothetical protein